LVQFRLVREPLINYNYYILNERIRKWKMCFGLAVHVLSQKDISTSYIISNFEELIIYLSLIYQEHTMRNTIHRN